MVSLSGNTIMVTFCQKCSHAEMTKIFIKYTWGVDSHSERELLYQTLSTKLIINALIVCLHTSIAMLMKNEKSTKQHYFKSKSAWHVSPQQFKRTLKMHYLIASNFCRPQWFWNSLSLKKFSASR